VKETVEWMCRQGRREGEVWVVVEDDGVVSTPATRLVWARRRWIDLQSGLELVVEGERAL
jgi:hypothetical protein